MRTDVKIAIVLSVVVVGVAAYYFSLPGDQDVRIEGDVQLAEVPSADAGGEGESGSSGVLPGEKAAVGTDRGREIKPGSQISSPAGAEARAWVPGPEAGEDHVAASGTIAPQLRTEAEENLFQEDGGTDVRPNRPATVEGQLPLPAPSSLGEDSAATVEVSAPALGMSDISKRQEASGEPGEPKPLPKRMDRLEAGLSTATAPSVSAKPKKAEPVKTHVVQAGETFASLAIRYYGSERYTRFLMRQNPQISDPRMLRVGDKLGIPALSVAKAKVPDAPAKKAAGAGRYLVRKDDTFYTIAASTLGDGTRWPEIYELNRDTVGDRPADLRAGQVLALPTEAKKGP